jgi:ADP-heptose:LPS heptosyltransferase
LIAHASRPLVGVHASGGRLSKQWHLDRFAAVARRLATERGATIVLTGSPADRSMVDEVASALDGVPVIRADGALDLPSLAALLEQLDVFITSDTGPMHLAATMRTPVVALFGPSDPKRYGPRAAIERIIRVDLPCSPCGQVRLPPVRCRGHVPDCMDGISVDVVVARALEVLDARATRQVRA